jgi:hypothetical protein
MDINQLKQFEKEIKYLFTNELPHILVEEQQSYFEIDNYIQSLQLKELKEIENNSDLLKKLNQTSIKNKSKITGLDEKIIIIIETKKEKATLEQLMIYCNILHIPFQKIVPEFFH